MIKDMMVAMSKPMHQMVHDQFEKNKDKLPADFEAQMTKKMDQMMNDFPWDEIIDAQVPIYQKHFTKGEIDALVTFYSAPTGQKILREMPAIMADAMTAMQPMLRRSINKMTNDVQEQIAQMLKESEHKAGSLSSSPN